MDEFSQGMEELAEGIDKGSDDFAKGLIAGAASVPRGYVRANVAMADYLGINGEDKQNLFHLRTALFDISANKFIHDEKFRSSTIKFIRRYHKEAFKALSHLSKNHKAFILGRFVGRNRAMSKMIWQTKASVYLGDFYHGITRSGDGIAVTPARLIMGDLIGELKQRK